MQTVLIVDDTRLNIEISKSLLSADYEVYTASNGEDALRIAQQQLIDLILLDVQMPVMDGYETCRRLKANPDTQHIPVIFVTAMDEAKQEIDGLSLGAIDYITKPITAAILKARVRNHLDLKQFREQCEAAKLKESTDLFRHTFEQAAVGIAHVSPTGSWLRVNQKLCDILGYTHDEMLELTFQKLTHPDDLSADLAHVWEMLEGSKQSYSMNKRYIRKDDSLVWCNLTVSLIRDEEERPLYFIAVVEDISLRKQAEEEIDQYKNRLEELVTERTAELAASEEKLRELSLTDDFTGFYNRRGFMLLAEQQLKLSTRLGKSFTIFFADMDSLKEINDNLGHAVGDQALLDMSAILRKSLRSSDTIARFGGDEFVGFSLDTGEPGGDKLLLRIRENLAVFNQTETRPQTLSFSIGAAVYSPEHPVALSALLDLADRRMYAEKQLKRQAKASGW